MCFNIRAILLFLLSSFPRSNVFYYYIVNAIF